MLSVEPTLPIYLYVGPADMRKGFAGLSGLIEAASYGLTETERLKIVDGGLFVFINRRRNRIKVLRFEGDGMAIYYKALEQGRYELPIAPTAPIDGETHSKIDATQLRLILDGIDLKSVKRRKRYAHSKP